MFSNSIIIFALFATVKSANILVVVPSPSISHQTVFRPLIQELVNRNHKVTVITTDPAYPEGKTPKNLTEIDLHDVSYNMLFNWYKKMGKVLDNNPVSVITYASRLLHDLFHYQCKDKSVLKLITDNSVKFDLLILEECVISTLVFSHIFKAPAILMSSHGDTHESISDIGALTHPLLFPTHFHKKIYNLTIWEKISELYNHIKFSRVFKNLESREDIMLKNTFGSDTPTLKELKNNVHMLLLNVHSTWLHNQPVPPNFVYIWGIHKTPEKILPKDLHDYLDSSKYGVVYVSFGTAFKSSLMEPETREILLSVLSRLPYDILFKWDLDELPGKPENIKISKWFPQTDILRHPNVKLFITQGGLQSTEEAINAGIPLIGIPLFADQEYNTEKYVHFKFGIKLDFKTLTIEKFETAIKTIFANYDSYRKNVISFRTQVQDQPKPALENTIWWVEYILRHGGVRHLRPPATNMPWTEYYEVELFIIVVTGLIIFVTAVLLTLYSCVCICCASIVRLV